MHQLYFAAIIATRKKPISTTIGSHASLLFSQLPKQLRQNIHFWQRTKDAKYTEKV